MGHNVQKQGSELAMIFIGMKQAGPLGDASFEIGIPKGLFLDEQGNSVQSFEAAPTDVLAVLIGLAAAGLDIASGHQNYTFNNLIACLICCDILQV